MKPKNYTIKNIKSETPSINSLILDKDLAADAGQFYMVWIKGVDEIPISPSSFKPGVLTVRNVGEATEAMCNLKENDKIGLRGPLGSSFEKKGKKILLVIGGVGSAPLLPFAEELSDRDLTVALGAITKKELLFEEKFRGLGEVIISTEDGSKGYEGYITEALEDLELSEFDSIYSCGPEPMMYKIFERVKDKDVFVQFSLHRYIKCGVGVCGSCCIDPEGLRACKEGPIFEKDDLKNTEFGDYKRNSYGKKTSLI